MLIGIAKMAAESELKESKRRVEYRALASKSYLNRCTSERMPFRWTLNPYRGCEFGCVYCYARYTHEFMEIREPGAFETRIFAKQWDEVEFRRAADAAVMGHFASASFSMSCAARPPRPGARPPRACPARR